MNDLRTMILSRHRSIHAFLRSHPELNRSTVYQVLGGRYCGNVQAQSRRIQAALEGQPAADTRRSGPDAAAIEGVLQAAKCGNCRRLDKRWCLECKAQTKHEALALCTFLEEQCDA